MFINKMLTACMTVLFILTFTSGAHAEEPKVMVVQKTNAHKKIFDIPVYIVPAVGLNTTVKTADGFVDKNKKISFEAFRIRAEYKTLLEEFNEDNLKKAGMELKARYEFVWNGNDAMLLKVFHKGKTCVMGKWTLIIDRGEETWMINGLYDAKNQKHGETVLNMLRSICWDDESIAAAFPKKIGDVEQKEAAGTPFRIAGMAQDALVYTKDGLLPTKSKDGSLFVVSRESDKYVIPGKQSDFAKERLEQIEPGKKLEVFSEKTVMINGLAGIELVAYTEEEPKSLIYQTILFDDKSNHVFVGIAHGDALENLEFFRALTGDRKER